MLPNAFSHVSDIRRVQVEAGVHTIVEAAWQSCQRLQIVKLPDTVVCLQDGAFQRCYELRTVLVPGCKQFGRSVFEECCSLSQIGAAEDTTNLLAPQAQVSPHAFALHFGRSTSRKQLPIPRTAHGIQYTPGMLPGVGH